MCFLSGSQELTSLVSFDEMLFEMQELLGQMSSGFANHGGAGKICSGFLGCSNSVFVQPLWTPVNVLCSVFSIISPAHSLLSKENRG